MLTTDGHAGRCYVLTGGEAITYAEIAEALAAATGREIAYVDVAPEAAREGLVQAGMPDWLVEHLDRAFERIRRGEFAQTTDTVRVLTGREPRTFAQLARDHAAAFAAAAPVSA